MSWKNFGETTTEEGHKVSFCQNQVIFVLMCDNNSPDSDITEDLGCERMAGAVDTIARRTFSKEGQSQAISELS